MTLHNSVSNCVRVKIITSYLNVLLYIGRYVGDRSFVPLYNFGPFNRMGQAYVIIAPITLEYIDCITV